MKIRDKYYPKDYINIFKDCDRDYQITSYEKSTDTMTVINIDKKKAIKLAKEILEKEKICEK